MKKIILLLTVVSTLSVVANPFDRFSVRQYQNGVVHYAVQKRAPQPTQHYFFAKEAAHKGNARAQFDLALMYARGTNGVAHDEKTAFHWFHKAARNNHVEAKFYMGLSFEQGRGVKKQASLARYWFKLASKSGHRQAMAHLASIENSLRPQYARGYRISYNRVNQTNRPTFRTF
jgi:TPR repeat protein